MPFLTIIEGGLCLLFCGGVYRQASIYHRKGDIFAKWGAGFVRLGQGGITSHPNVKWREIDVGSAGLWRETGHRVEFVAAVEMGVAAE